MGSTWGQGMTLDGWLKEDLAGHKILARGGGLSDGERQSTWLATQRRDDGSIAAVEVLWSKWDGGTCVKYVSEDMGPGEVVIPDNVWDAIKDTPPLNEWSERWRGDVAAYREEFPIRVRDLGEGSIGLRYRIGDAMGHLCEYRGRRPALGKGTCQVFVFDGEETMQWGTDQPIVRKFPKTEERLLRCRYAEAGEGR